MKFKKLTFAQIPMIATLTLAKTAEILQFEDGAIELYVSGEHLATWTQKDGLKAGRSLPATRKD